MAVDSETHSAVVRDLEARLASQERALGVAVGALKKIEQLGHSDHHARGYTLANIADRALTQIEGEGEE